MIDQTGLNIYDYWYDVKECTSCGVYWVNLEIKDCNSIETLLYTYLCIALCISADGCISWQAWVMFYSSPLSVGLAKTKEDIAQMSSHSYLSWWYISSKTYILTNAPTDPVFCSVYTLALAPDNICTHLPFYTLYVFLHGKIAPNALFCYWVLMMATSSSYSINAIFFTYRVSCKWFGLWNHCPNQMKFSYVITLN